MRGRKLDSIPAVLAAFGCIIALLFVGSICSANFHLTDLSAAAVLQVASFLGIIVASGLMLVILLGQIGISRSPVVTYLVA